MHPRRHATIAAYDAAAAAYLERWSPVRPREDARRFASLAGRGAVVLDPACGPGIDLRLLRDAGLTVVAGDRGAEAVRVGHTFFPKSGIARWDLHRLPFTDDTFAGVWAARALQHLPLAEVRTALAELRRVQARGPIFVALREGRGELEPLEDPPAGTVYVNAVTVDELRALLAAAGYAAVEVERRPDLAERSGVAWLHAIARVPEDLPSPRVAPPRR